MADELNGAAPAAAESTSAPETTPSAPVESTPTEAPRALGDTIRDVADKIWERDNPPRENGKFAPRDAPQEQAAPDTETPDQPEEKGTEPATPAIDPPRSWSAEMQAKFNALPPEVRTYVAERDKETFRQISQMGAQIKAVEPVRNVLEQHRDYLQRVGRTEADAVAQLFKASRSLDQNPAATIKWLADNYRVDLRQLAQNQQQAPAPVTTDPRLEARLRRMEAEAAQRTQAEQTAREQNVASTIEKFAQEKPHFKFYEAAITAHVRDVRDAHPHMDPSSVLEEAYKLAVKDTEQIIADQRKADEAKRKAEQDKQIKEARRQSSLNQSSNGRGSTPVKGSIRDSLMRHADRLMGSS